MTRDSDDAVEPPVATDPWLEFEHDLRDLINRHSRENGSDTPDLVLAAYLVECLKAFDEAVVARDRWYGRKTKAALVAEPEARG